MIQRIQSVYWLLASVLLAIFYFSDFAFVKSAVVSITLSVFYGIECTPTGVYATDVSFWPLHVLVILAALLTFVTIFLFKRHSLQIRLSAVSIVLDCGLMGLSYFYYRQVASGIADGLASLSMLYLLPLIAIILTFLGLMGVKKDMAILRSLSRL